ncbi:Uncharacterised protein [Vibrio cholerae]|nr:Uncharacterised protein [Vibrio cholerae]CSI53781.1 Uncharacterised protein [Vibrio cholerae]
MRDDDHGAVTRIQRIFQPANGVDVQVVGRFVKQHDIWICKQDLRQQHTQFPTRSHTAHQAVMLLKRNTHREK